MPPKSKKVDKASAKNFRKKRMFQVTFSKAAHGRSKTASVKVIRVDGPGCYLEKYFRYTLNDAESFSLAMRKANEYVNERKEQLA